MPAKPYLAKPRQNTRCHAKPAELVVLRTNRATYGPYQLGPSETRSPEGTPLYRISSTDLSMELSKREPFTEAIFLSFKRPQAGGPEVLWGSNPLVLADFHR